MNDQERHQEFIDRALDLSIDSVKNGGGPFAALIVKDERIISVGQNIVTEQHDPTAHAEIMAIRNAAQELGTHDLSGCEIYCSCEPCPMCLGAIYWARISKIYYANKSNVAARFGFDDSYFFEEFKKSSAEREIPELWIDSPKALIGFDYWDSKKDKVRY